jgi:hypothetical protein
LERLFAVLDPSASDAQRLVEWARALRTEFVSWRFALRKGLAAKQIEVGQLEKEAHRVRVFQVSVIPGLLQIPEYAHHVMRLSDVTHQPDIERAVALRIQRQQLLYEPGHHFEFLIMESAALSRFCERSIVARQLDRLRFLAELPNVSIGFISNQTALPAIPRLSFQVFDLSMAVVESLTGEFTTRDVESCNKLFEDFASVALFNEHADEFLDSCKQSLSAHDTISPKHDRLLIDQKNRPGHRKPRSSSPSRSLGQHVT